MREPISCSPSWSKDATMSNEVIALCDVLVVN